MVGRPHRTWCTGAYGSNESLDLATVESLNSDQQSQCCRNATEQSTCGRHGGISVRALLTSFHRHSMYASLCNFDFGFCLSGVIHLEIYLYDYESLEHLVSYKLTIALRGAKILDIWTHVYMYYCIIPTCDQDKRKESSADSSSLHLVSIKPYRQHPKRSSASLA